MVTPSGHLGNLRLKSSDEVSDPRIGHALDGCQVQGVRTTFYDDDGDDDDDDDDDDDAWPKS